MNKEEMKKLLSDQIFRYRNGLYLNQDVVSEEKWAVDHITKRIDKLVAIKLDMYNC